MGMFDNIKLLKDLNKKDLEFLEMFCQEREVKKGDLLFRQGDVANSLYLLSKGEVEVFTNDSNNNEIILGKIMPEEILGEMAIFGGQTKRMASARVIKDAHLIILLDFSIKELTKKHPEILEKIKNIIEERKKINNKTLGK